MKCIFGFPYFEFRIKHIYNIYIVSVVSEPKYKREKKRECEIENNTVAVLFLFHLFFLSCRSIMATDSFVQPAIPKFDGHYDHWSMLMENFLRSKEYWQVVSEGITEPAADTAVSNGQRTELEAQRLKDEGFKGKELSVSSY